MKNIGIYKFENLLNNKIYIGQSIHLKTRFHEHKRNHQNKNHVNYYCDLYKAFREFGFENFSFEIIEYCKENELNEKEIFWVNYFDSYNNGYNMTPGGDFNPSKIPEIVKKRTEKLLNDPEINQKLASRGNSKLTEEDVIKIRTLYKEGKTFGEVYPLFTDKISRSAVQNCWRGKTWPEIMPEVYQERKMETVGGSKLTSKLVCQLRQDFMDGLTKEELIQKYNISRPNLGKILRIDRWNKIEAIPENYIDFISK